MYSKNPVMPRSFGNLLEDIFQNGISKVWSDEGLTDRADAPVNIKETDKSYELQLLAPGLKKEEFKVNVDKNILTISYEHKEESSEHTDKWLRSEFKSKSFKRSFSLNDKIDNTSIAAKYNDGILYLSLPKKEQTEVSSQAISVN